MFAILDRYAMRFLSKKHLGTLLFVPIAVGTVWPQTLSGVSPASGTVLDPVSGTNRISGLLEPSPSYFLGGLHVSTGAENNPSLLSANSSEVSSVTNLVGEFNFRKFWHHFGTSIDYTGADTLYPNYGGAALNNQQFQRVSADEVIRWTTGQLSIKDLFSYTGVRDFGSLSPGGIGNPTSTGSEFFGATLFAPSFDGNLTVASLTQALTRRSSVNFSAGYSFTDYLSNSEGLFNSRQASSQAGYTYQISRKSIISVQYGYRDFQFVPAVQSVVTNSAQFVFERHFSDHVDLVLGGGPERILTVGTSTQSQINATVQASLGYRRKRSHLDISYHRMVTPGSGVYAGGIGDTAMVSFDRRLSRSWDATISGSYDRISGLGVRSFGLQVPESRYWLAGITVHRRLGRSLSAFANYQFNYDTFLSCGGLNSCGPSVNRNIMLVGFDWSIHPVHRD
jgi:hypothetical protein